MPEFTDNRGEKWTLAVNGGTIKRGLDLLKLDLGSPPAILQRLPTEIVLLVDVLYVACKPEADRRGVSDVEFGERLGGDALRQAYEGFLEAWIDFFRSLGQTAHARLIEYLAKMTRGAQEAAAKHLDDPTITAMVEQKLAELGSFSASWPPSPESQTPSPAPSGN